MVFKISLIIRKKSSWNVPQQKNQANDIKSHPLLQRIIKCTLQRRHFVTLLGCICAAMINSHRLAISIAMVAMVNNTSTINANQDNNATEECPAYYANVTSHDQSRGKFDWSPELQGYIIGAGYLGFFLTQIPGGILTKIYGTKKLIVAALLIASACNFLTPLSARANPYILMTLTLIRGMAQGINQPALTVLMSKWFPKDERGVLCSFIYNGFPIGIAITGLAGGKLCDLEFMGGWPLIFYVFGLTSTILAVTFVIFYYDSPEKDPRISDAELKYIQNNQEKSDCSECPPIPWMKMLLSIPTVELVIGLFGAYWMIFYLVSVHPIYVGTTLHIPIKESGILSSTPFILQAVAGFLTSYYCYKNKRFSVDKLRRGINSFSFLLFITGMLGVYFAKCDIVLNEVFLYIALFGAGFSFGGCFITSIDMSPTFCGPLMGFVSTVASLAGFIVSIVAGKLTNVEQSLSQWGKVFFTVIGVCFLCALIFQLFGSAKIQPYDPTSIKCPEDSKTGKKIEESDGGKTSARL